MGPEAFLSHWRRAYGETPLAGHALREGFARRWVRIHSLPEARRYARTGAERDEILRRQNRVLDDLIGEGNDCTLVFGFHGEEERAPADARAALDQLMPSFLMTYPSGGGALSMASLSWRHGALDPILRAVADDELETVLFVRAQPDRLLAPYDGGMDIIVESEAARQDASARYAAWLSSHPAGL